MAFDQSVEAKSDDQGIDFGSYARELLAPQNNLIPGLSANQEGTKS